MILCSLCGITKLDFRRGAWHCPKCDVPFQPKRVAMALIDTESMANILRKAKGKKT